MENYDQRLIQDSRAFDFADDDDEFDFEQCMPIVCEDDDEPDFTIMNKKTEKAQVAEKKGQDIRKRFQLEKPAPGSAQNLSGQNSEKSHATASTDFSNPLASMTGDQLRQQMQGGRTGGIPGNGERLGLPKELDFSSDENEDFLALDAND